ncbi:hypothetical protein CL633_02405 [bacterium]|nr:hypothetical protein [bacterium]|tara:strand:- start:3829 stop:4080 length:252 start_codon:yes stop_codon:yes gene_type:complete
MRISVKQKGEGLKLEIKSLWGFRSKLTNDFKISLFLLGTAIIVVLLLLSACSIEETIDDDKKLREELIYCEQVLKAFAQEIKE